MQVLRVSSSMIRPSKRMLSTDLEWIILRMLLLAVRSSSITLDTLRPPPVLPAHAPMNISNTRIVREYCGHWSKSMVPKPVVVMIDETEKNE